MRRIVNQYSEEFKLKVVKEYLESDQSISSLMEKYEIRGSSCITNWIRKFGMSKSDYVNSMSLDKRPETVSVKSNREQELEARIKKLEKEVEYEKLRSHALDTMINVAERDLKIPIRKKPGAKQ
jgi:transposase-like protein